MTSYIKQIREYPNIRLEENNRVSFDCSDDLFIRLARSVYMKEIWMQIKNESPQKYLHFTGDKYYRKLETIQAYAIRRVLQSWSSFTQCVQKNVSCI